MADELPGAIDDWFNPLKAKARNSTYLDGHSLSRAVRADLQNLAYVIVMTPGIERAFADVQREFESLALQLAELPPRASEVEHARARVDAALGRMRSVLLHAEPSEDAKILHLPW